MESSSESVGRSNQRHTGADHPKTWPDPGTGLKQVRNGCFLICLQLVNISLKILDFFILEDLSINNCFITIQAYLLENSARYFCLEKNFCVRFSEYFRYSIIIVVMSLGSRRQFKIILRFLLDTVEISWLLTSNYQIGKVGKCSYGPYRGRNYRCSISLSRVWYLKYEATGWIVTTWWRPCQGYNWWFSPPRLIVGMRPRVGAIITAISLVNDSHHWTSDWLTIVHHWPR